MEFVSIVSISTKLWFNKRINKPTNKQTKISIKLRLNIEPATVLINLIKVFVRKIRARRISEEVLVKLCQWIQCLVEALYKNMAELFYSNIHGLIQNINQIVISLNDLFKLFDWSSNLLYSTTNFQFSGSLLKTITKIRKYHICWLYA